MWRWLPGILPILLFCGEAAAAAEKVRWPEPAVSWPWPGESSRRYEAEEVVAEPERLTRDRLTAGKWDVWSRDPGGKWSGGKVLRGDRILQDRIPGTSESAVLKFRIPVKKSGKYDVFAAGARCYGASRDGKTFQRHQGKSVLFRSMEAEAGFLEFYLANCYADSGNPGCPYLDYFIVTEVRTPPVMPPVSGFASRPVRERFNRGVTAIPFPGGGVYVSWRLLAEDPEDISFEVFRTRRGGTEKVTAAPVAETCDFIDASGRAGDVYEVRPVSGGSAVSGSAAVWGEKDAAGTPCRRIRLSDPKRTAFQVGVGDLNGDGSFDYVFKTPNLNIDPWERYWRPSPEPYVLEAYLADGTPLWKKSLGWSIETGVWYSPFIVYDFNGDGRAEVAVKMGKGDPRDEVGRVLSGPEYLMVLDGMTGREIARAPWPSRTGFGNYNVVSRNQLAMARLDGKTPCIIALRGTYNTMKAEAWQLDRGSLKPLWKFDNRAMGAAYQGQGAHSTITADIDGDGREEVVLGSMALDDNGSILWSTGMRHNDYMFFTDIMPENPGPEIAYIYETPQPRNGICVVDARTGRILWGLKQATGHVHRGYAIDMDPVHPGVEVAGSDHDLHQPKQQSRWLFSGSGKLLQTGPEIPVMLYGIYWDADLEREIAAPRIRDFAGGPVGGGFSGRMLLIADLFGDWREEVIASGPGEVRIYSTTIPAMDRRVTLMQDDTYRNGVLNNAQGYYNDPNLLKLPTLEAVNLSLIAQLGDGKNFCQVTVSAPRHAGLAGKVVLLPPPGIRLSSSSLEVKLAAGDVSVTKVQMDGKIVPGTVIRAVLTVEGGRRYRSGVALFPKVSRVWAAGTVKLPAASLVSETGGRVSVVRGRPGAADGCMIAWDNAGHRISWQLNLPAAGRYQLLLSRATPMDVERRLSVNGREIGVFQFSSTGGFGNDKTEWVLSECGPVLELKSGVNTITLENTNGSSMNLAYLYCEPVKK